MMKTKHWRTIGWLFVGVALLTVAWNLRFPEAAGVSGGGGKVTAAAEGRRGTEGDAPPAEKERRPARAKDRNEDLEQISAWIADDGLDETEIARRMWKMASNPAKGMEAREEALAHALNLTDDEQWEEEVIPLLGESGLWTGALAQRLVDDLYNRPDGMKMIAAARLICVVSGEPLEELRDLLKFQLNMEEATDQALIQEAEKKSTGGGEEEE